MHLTKVPSFLDTTDGLSLRLFHRNSRMSSRVTRSMAMHCAEEHLANEHSQKHRIRNSTAIGEHIGLHQPISDINRTLASRPV
jgi:hypothetical protein